MPRLLGSPRLPTAPRGERQRLKSAAAPRVLGWRSSWWPGLRQGGDVEGPVSRWTWLDLGGPSAAEKICILWHRVGGGGGEDKGATGPAEKQLSAGSEQRNSPSEESGPASRLRTVNPETLRGISLATSVPGIQRNPPRGGPQPGYLPPASPGFSILLYRGWWTCTAQCHFSWEKRTDGACVLCQRRQKKKKKKIPPTCILWSWGLCPHFPEADN